MPDSINCANQQIPSYSGITINITNPATAFPPPPNMQQGGQSQVNGVVTNPNARQPQNYINRGEYLEPVNSSFVDNKNYNTGNEVENSGMEVLPQAYPSGYYINNIDATKVPNQMQRENANDKVNQGANFVKTANVGDVSNNSGDNEEINTDTSKEIISELDKKNEEQKELEKNGKKEKVVSLTNEYIMSLENYLNNPNTDIRLMAAKEILTRLDEDKSRYDDAALNALLNKMLQDPNKLVRIAAMSAFSSELASGNDYTVQLLNQIQQNPEADPEDVLEASQILLKRSSSTEVRYTPVVNREIQTVNEPVVQTQQKVEV